MILLFSSTKPPILPAATMEALILASAYVILGIHFGSWALLRGSIFTILTTNRYAGTVCNFCDAGFVQTSNSGDEVRTQSLLSIFSYTISSNRFRVPLNNAIFAHVDAQSQILQSVLPLENA